MVVVGEAKNGQEALEMGRTLDWDVAVFDYSMPGRSGVELVKEIKRHHPDRPVLVLSMHPEELHATQVFKAGGSGYLNKESAGEELTTAIRKVAKGGRYVSAALAEKAGLGALARQREGAARDAFRPRVPRDVAARLGQVDQPHRPGDDPQPEHHQHLPHADPQEAGLSNNAQLVHYAITHKLIE
jgi:DNA-binding NarL/FixJ family response regulator